MLFSKRWILTVLGILGLTASVLYADETQGSWLTTLTQNALPASDEKPATVAGTRGLNESSEPVDTTARNDAAIDQLDKVNVSSAAVDRFIAEGKLQ